VSRSDEILQALAFQRGMLTLLKDANPPAEGIEKAIEGIDTLIERFSPVSSR